MFCFFLCVVTSFFRLVFTKLVMHFFWLVSFCILSHVFICAVYNYLFICLLTSFIFVIVCVIALLPHFFVLLSSSPLLFFLPNCSYLLFDVCAGFLPCHFLDLRDFLPPYIRFCCFANTSLVLLVQPDFPFGSLQLFSMFFLARLNIYTLR